MKFRVVSNRAMTRKMKTQVFLRWFFYALTLMLAFSLMSCGAFRTWQPYFIIPLCIGVAMREQDFSSSVFGIFCGFFLDIGTGMLFGFHALILMIACMFTSLLSRNLIKVNILNHLICTAITTLLTFTLFYSFRYAIWDLDGAELLIWRIYLPSFIATCVTSFSLFLLTKFIATHLGLEEVKEVQSDNKESDKKTDRR